MPNENHDDRGRFASGDAHSGPVTDASAIHAEMRSQSARADNPDNRAGKVAERHGINQQREAPKDSLAVSRQVGKGLARNQSRMDATRPSREDLHGMGMSREDYHDTFGYKRGGS